MARKRLLPHLKAIITLPDILDPDSSAAYMRVHARCVRAALKDVMVDHHRHRIPGHFQRGATGKYGYKPRAPGTNRAKAKRGYVLDLVSGENVGNNMHQSMKRGYKKLTFSGSFGGDGSVTPGGIAATLVYDLPHHVTTGEDNKPWQVDKKQMVKEIGDVTRQEAQEMAIILRHSFIREMNQALSTGNKIRKRIEGAGHYLGD